MSKVPSFPELMWADLEDLARWAALSPAEAASDLEVPLEYAMALVAEAAERLEAAREEACECSYCHGSGGGAAEWRCPHCDGTGDPTARDRRRRLKEERAEWDYDHHKE
jgi:DnaJ-class molecular chaperone